MTEAELRKLYPKCFSDEHKPLALGIHEQLQLPYPSRVLHDWCNSPLYLRNVLAGMPRINLDGIAVETPDLAQRRYAYQALIFLRSRLAGVDQRVLTKQEQQELKRRMPKEPTEEE